jgi:hypothetical protein
VERPHVVLEEECRVEEAPHVINIVQPTPEPLQDVPISESLIKKEMCMCSPLSLLHLLAKHTQRIEPLVDYF